LVFVDEIGRLELNRGGGLVRLVPLLARPRAARPRTQSVIAIVRDTLLDRLLARVRDAEPRVVTVNPRRREVAWEEMTRLVLEDRTNR
jgi:nucleoside-triphosphatase THEP1